MWQFSHEKTNQLRSRHHAMRANARKIAQRLVLGKEETATDLAIRRNLQSSYDDAGHRLMCCEVLQTQAGEDLPIWAADLSKTFQAFCKTPSFRRLLSLAVQRHGNRMRFLLHHDEITPGNPLRPTADNGKKGTLLFCSFLEFGQNIRREEAWIPGAVLRSCDMGELPGGLSQALACVVRQWVRSGVFDRGFTAELDWGPQHIHVDIYRLPADMAAHKDTWSIIGAGGHRCCMKCSNVVSVRSDVANKDPWFCDICESDSSKFVRVSDQDFFEVYDNLCAMAPHLNQTSLKKQQTAMGLNYNPYGIAASPELRRYIKPSMCTFDGMHCLLSNGAANWELCDFLDACAKKMGQQCMDDVREVLAANWEYPHARQHASICTPAARLRCFSDAKVDKESYKGNASQLLTVLPLVAFWAIMVAIPDGRALLEAESFVKLCSLVAEWQKLKRKGAIHDASALMNAWSAHLESLVKAYGKGKVKPKHHYTSHLGEQEFAVDCFTQERKGDVYKHSAAENMNSNSGRFAFSCMSQLLVTQLVQLQEMPADAFCDKLLPVWLTHRDFIVLDLRSNLLEFENKVLEKGTSATL